MNYPQVYVKNKGGGHAEAWVEDWDSKAQDFAVTCLAKLMIHSDGECLIDTIDTPVQYRRKGYATKLVETLQQRFKRVAPMGVTPSGKPFWDKLGMKDALGENYES